MAPLPWLRRSPDASAEVAALARTVGGACGLPLLLTDLNRQARRVSAPWLLGRAVSSAIAWDDADRVDPRWWPQGVTTCAEATPGLTGRRVALVSWYSKTLDSVTHGSRITVIDLATLRYRHVLLVVPTVVDGDLRLSPLRVHAGGIAWSGSWLHVAATGRGFFSAQLDDLIRIPDDAALIGDPRLGASARGIASYGYRYLLPVRMRHHSEVDDALAAPGSGGGADVGGSGVGDAASPPAQRLRFSFLTTVPSTVGLGGSGVAKPNPVGSPAGPTPSGSSVDGPALLAGEYGRRGRQSTRLARFDLGSDGQVVADAAGVARPTYLADASLSRMQGATYAEGRWYVTTSQGAVFPGSVHTGTIGALRAHHLATPIGPEDITWWPETDELWSVTEHPHRRWLFSMRRGWFD